MVPNETREMADLACTRRDGRVPETYQPLGEFDFECHERYATLLGLGKRREESVAPEVNIAPLADEDEAQIGNVQEPREADDEHSAAPNLPGIAALRAEVRVSNERANRCKSGASFVEMVRTRNSRGKSRTVRIDVSRGVSHGGDFDAIKHRLDTTLTDHVRRLSAERERTYAYKVRALDDVFLKGDPGAPKRLDPVEWRLECERRRLWDSIRALDTHPWYARILKVVGTSEGTAYFLSKPGGGGAGGIGEAVPGGFGAAGADNRGFARREPNRAELVVGVAVRDVIESGRMFDRDAFFTMCAGLDPKDLSRGERMVAFIRNELGVSADEYEEWVSSRG